MMGMKNIIFKIVKIDHWDLKKLELKFYHILVHCEWGASYEI